LPQYFGEQVLVGCGSGRGHSSRDHLASATGYCQVGLVGEVAAKVRPVNQRRLGVGAAHQPLVGRQRLLRSRRPFVRIRVPRLISLLAGFLVETLQVLRDRKGRLDHILPSDQGVDRRAGPDERAVHVDRSFLHQASLPAELDRLAKERLEHFIA
jgi:hypothetical protein